MQIFFDMKTSIRPIIILIFIATIMAGCKKVEIMTQKTRYGEASVNGVKLYDYATVKELLTNSVAHQLMPLADFIKTGNGVSYLQTTLRKENEDDPNNFWFILIGIPADESFPVLNKEYNICYNENVEYGSIHRSFKYTRELENLFNSGLGDETLGIAGIRTPTSGNELLPLTGKISFYKYDEKNGIYYSRYTLESLEDAGSEPCLIEGEFHKQIQIYN